MENEVRRLVSLVDQHEQKMTTLNSDHSRRLQEERMRWETKQVTLNFTLYILKSLYLLGAMHAMLIVTQNENQIKAY